jgi:aryl-alcohol dehydrogenase-like predicted oxidoreductase
VTAPIVGARSMEQLEANLGAVDWLLSADQMQQLDKASEKPLPYPYDRHAALGMR